MVRGYILNNLLESVNKYIALIITASLFGILHLANPNVSLVGFINIILAGVLLGIYYIHKKNLWFPIGIHFTWNLFQGPVFGFEVSGTNSIPYITQSIQGNELLTGGEFGFEASLLATFLMIAAILIVHFQFKEKTVQTNPYF
jgi:membrane protease YdiL (CAAX protease family)